VGVEGAGGKCGRPSESICMAVSCGVLSGEVGGGSSEVGVSVVISRSESSSCGSGMLYASTSSSDLRWRAVGAGIIPVGNRLGTL